MKTPLPTEERSLNRDADLLRSQYFRTTDERLATKSDKKEGLLTPFLLSIPVVIMLIILIYSL